MLRFGTKSFTQGIVGKLTSRTNPLIIAAALGLQLVPFYAIPKNLVGAVLTTVVANLYFSPLIWRLWATCATRCCSPFSVAP